MNKTDMEFFETYKRLDRLCSDVFGLRNGGVTRYIDELKAIGYGCTEDCKTLKRLRHIRNQMAHDELLITRCVTGMILYGSMHFIIE